MIKKAIMVMVSVALIATIFVGCGNATSQYTKEPGIYTIITVKKKQMVFELYYKKAPLTVTNFVGLAQGTFSGNVEREDRYFDGLTFHRVVPSFVIQGGDPLGNGQGGPGYSFVDEGNEGLSFLDGPGVLAMANSGTDTNGSQFFITSDANENFKTLDAKHTIFGKIVFGEEVISEVLQGDTIDSVKIIATGDEAKTFVEDITWDSFQGLMNEKKEEKEFAKQKKYDDTIAAIEASDMEKVEGAGVYYSILSSGRGKKVRNGKKVTFHYVWTIYGTDKVIDSTRSRNQPTEMQIENNNIPGLNIALKQLREGDIANIVISPELAYGDRGAQGGTGGSIPPHAFLQFEIEIVRVE